MMYQTTVFDVSLQSVFLARPNRTFGLGTSLGLHWQNMAIQACQVGWYFVCTHRDEGDEVWTNGSKKTTKTMSLHMLASGPGLTSIDRPFSSSVSKWLVLVASSWNLLRFAKPSGALWVESRHSLGVLSPQSTRCSSGGQLPGTPPACRSRKVGWF